MKKIPLFKKFIRTFFILLVCNLSSTTLKGQCYILDASWSYTIPDERVVPFCTPITVTATICNYNNVNVSTSLNVTHWGTFNSLDLGELQDCGITNNIQSYCSSTITLYPYSCKTFTFVLRSNGGDLNILSGNFTTSPSNCNSNNLPPILIIPQKVSVVGQTGQTTNFSQFNSGIGFIPHHLLVKGNVILDVNHVSQSLGNSIAFIAMDEGATITIPNGKTLFLIGADVHGCTRRWNSISVETGGSILSGPQNLSFNRRSKIKDAENAILAMDGSTIDVIGTDFTDNHRGIFAPSVNYNSNTYFSPLFGCKFEGTGSMKPPIGSGLFTSVYEYPYAGIEVQKVSSLDISRRTVALPFGLTRLNTEFVNMANGIISTNSNINLNGCTFSGLLNYYASSNVTGNAIYNNGNGSWSNCLINNCTMDNCTTGILVEQTYSIGIQNTTINNYDNTTNSGIKLINNSGFLAIKYNKIKAGSGTTSYSTSPWSSDDFWNNINQNIIEVSNSYSWSGNGIEAYENGSSGGLNIKGNDIDVQQGHIGILFNGANGANLVNNYVTLENSATSFATGIEASGNYNLHATCNSILNPSDRAYRRGISTYGSSYSDVRCNGVSNMNYGLLMVGACTNSQYKGNNINSSDYGILYAYNTQTGVQLHNGNKWNGSFSAFGAQHSGGTFEAFLSPYVVASTVQPIYPGSVNPNSWFVPQSGTSYTCQATSDCPNASGLVAQTPTSQNALNRALMSTTDTKGITPEMKWTMQRHLNRYLTDKPEELSQDVKFKDFQRNMGSTSVSKMAKIENTIKAYYNDGKVSKDKIAASLTSYDDLYKQYADAADVFYKKEKAKSNDPEYQKMLSILSKIQKLNDANDKELKVMDKSKKLLISDKTLLENEGVSTFLLPEDNEKEINKISIQLLINPNSGLDSKQKAVVMRIAPQCPSAGGDAVYRARSLYQLIEPKHFDDMEICGKQATIREAPSEKTDLTSPVFKAYPNPVKDYLNVVLPNAANTEGGEWLIYNAIGGIVKQFAATQSSLDVRDLSKGIYFIHFQSMGEDQFTQKFVKID